MLQNGLMQGKLQRSSDQRCQGMQRILCRGKHKTFPLQNYLTNKEAKEEKTQVLVPVHAAGEHRPAELFRYNIILQKSQNHGKKGKEDQKGLLPDSKDPLSSSVEARPAYDDNTATKPSLNSSKLTCEFEKSGQHCFLRIRNTLAFGVFLDGRSYIAFSTEDIYFFEYFNSVQLLSRVRLFATP